MRPAIRTASRTVAPLRAGALAGPDLVALLADELDDLARSCGAPATGRAPWLAATVGALPARASWAVAVRDADEVLRAALVLLDGVEPDEVGWDTITLAGCAQGYRSTVLADSAAAAALLGHEFAQVLSARRRPVRVTLGPLDPDVAWLDAFHTTIPRAELFACDAIPSVRRATGAVASDYLSPAMRRTLRKANNRLTTDARHVVVRTTRDARAVADLLPVLERVHQERHHAQGRPSVLDDLHGRRVWGARLLSLAAEGEVEVATLYLDDDVAAQVVAIVDGASYRVYDGTLAGRWARYAPGRVLEAAVLQRALDDPTVDELDWMTAVASESLLAANAEQPACVLRVDHRP